MPDVRAGLQVRLLADRSTPRYDPATGELEPWPLAGVRFEGDTPSIARVPTSWVSRGRSEGWLTVEGERVVHRPGGPAGDPWRADKVHTFQHLDAIILHTVDGDVRFRVVHQPDKYATQGDSVDVTDDVYASGETRVDWFYDIDLEA